VLFGCSTLRYSQVTPEAKDFHPQRIGVFPVDVGSYEEARGSVDQIIAGVLMDKKWFTDVVAADTMTTLLGSNEELRKLVLDYTLKLKTVNFSDPDMSRKIGEIAKVDAFLIVGIDYWNYTVENGKKIAKVGFAFKMINAANGNIVWKAGHALAKDYMVLKPSLDSVAKSVINEMIGHMPR
jgi:hypothetical protein